MSGVNVIYCLKSEVSKQMSRVNRIYDTLRRPSSARGKRDNEAGLIYAVGTALLTLALLEIAGEPHASQTPMTKDPDY